MTILVTGGAGYIGSHMALELVRIGRKVVVIDDLSTGIRAAVPRGAAFYYGDVADRDLVRRVIGDHGVRDIAHFAAKTVVPDSVADPLDYYLSNTMKSRALLASATEFGVERIIFSSTAAVYGDVSAEPVRESSPLAPMSPYGRSKLMTEWMIDDAARAYGLKYIILRYFNVAGADPLGQSGQSTPRATHLIKTAVQAALRLRNGMDIYGVDYPTPDGSCLRDFIQVTDLARAHVLALDHLSAGGASGVYNCGYGRGVSVKEIVSVVKEMSGVDFETRIVSRRPGDPASVIADATRIRVELGWTPAYDDIRAIVGQALAWERSIARHRAA